MTDKQPIDQRQHARYPVCFPVAYDGEGGGGQGQAADLSILGCAVVSDAAVEPKTYVKLHLSMPDGESPLEIELAVVRWCHGGVFGVEFIAFGEVQKTRLKRFLSSVAAPSLLQS
jgi:PilZ domain